MNGISCGFRKDRLWSTVFPISLMPPPLQNFEKLFVKSFYIVTAIDGPVPERAEEVRGLHRWEKLGHTGF